MANTYTETILFDLPLPHLLVQFKNSINSILVPRLNNIIADIQQKQPNSSILSLLCLFIFFLIIKSVIQNLFKSNDESNNVISKPVTQSQIDEEIRALTNQIRNVKNSLKKIIKQTAKQPLQQAITQKDNDINPEDVSRLMDYYKQSAQDFNNLAQIILNSQQSIFKQLKNAKKLRAPAEKTSSHGSRESKQSKQQVSTENIWQDKQINEFKPTKQENDPVETQVQQQIAEPEVRTEIKMPPVIPKQIRPPAQGGIKKRVPPPPIPRS